MSNPVKIRKGKNSDTFYCRLWNGQKQNTETITLGKKTKDFTLSNATEKYEFIRDLFNQKKWNYKDYLKKDQKEQLILKNENELTFEKVFYKYFEKKLPIKEDEFINKYKSKINITRDNFKESVQWKKKYGAWNSKKNSFEDYFLAVSYNLENVPKKDGTPSKRFKKNGIKEKEYIANKLFIDFNKEDIEYIHKKIKNRKWKGNYLEQKTISNILKQLKTIIAWGIEEYELDMINPFFKIKKEERQELLKDPKLRRERILKEDEFLKLFDTLFDLPNKNAFFGALLGYTFCLRSESALNVRKIDFIPVFEDGEYFYNKVNLMNMKTHTFYECPIPKHIGKFLYQYLLDHKLEEYVLRQKRKGSRPKIPKPLGAISEDYYNTSDYLFFYVDSMKKLKDMIDSKDEALLIKRKEYLKYRVKEPKKAEIAKAMKEQLLKEKEFAEEKLKEYIAKLKSNKDYVRKKHFDFHSLRHQMASQMTKHNFQYTKYLLSHSEQSSREDEISLRYSKIDFEDLKEKMNLVNMPIYEEILKNSEIMEDYKKQSDIHLENYNTQIEKQKNPITVMNEFALDYKFDNTLAEDIIMDNEIEKASENQIFNNIEDELKEVEL